MEQIYNEQSEIAEAMGKLFINMRKDGEERKSSPNYYKRKLELLETYWTDYQQNHKKLVPFEDKQHPYFGRNEFDRTKKLYSDIEAYIGEKTSAAEDVYHQSKAGGSKQGGELRSEQDQRRETMEDTYEVRSGRSRSVGSASKLDEMLRRQHTNFKAFMRTVGSVDVELLCDQWEFENVLRDIQSRWQLVDSLHWEIVHESDDDINEDYLDAFSQHEMTYNNMKRELNTKLHAVSYREKSTPQIDIPTFSGDYQQWTSFKNQFMEAVHLNPAIAKAQKLQHLKGKLRGEAEKIIQHLSISAENYSTAWELLQKRYTNKKRIFASHLNDILNLPNMQQQSLVQIQRMHDVTLESLHAIKNLGVDTANWDPIIEHILTLKLDSETHDSYVESLKRPKEIPTLEDLLNFLESKFNTIEQRRKQVNSYQKTFSPNYQSRQLTSNYQKTYQKRIPYNNYQYNNNNMNHHHNNNTNYNNQTRLNKPFNRSYHVSSGSNPYKSCPLCQQGHGLFMCQQFLEMNNNQKLQTVTNLNVCVNCLYPHYGKQCYSMKRCRVGTCTEVHNTLLHDAFATQRKTQYGQSVNTFNKNNRPRNGSNTVNVSQKEASEILLSTAMVNVLSADGTYYTLRALIDPGSQISLITEKAAQMLGIKRQSFKGVIYGIGEKSNMCKGIIKINCQSTYSPFKFEAEVLIMSNLIKNLPNTSFDKPSWHHIENIDLADPEFFISRPVDLLLGADVYATILLDGIHKDEHQNQPLAQKTHLGWILCGSVMSFQCNVVSINLDSIHKFWEVEEIEETTEYNVEEQKCIELYDKTTRRLQNGRYEVKMPLHENFEKKLGSSKEIACAQFRNLEKKFIKEPVLAQDYRNFINEYQLLGHMKLASNKSNKIECFLPHHAVQRAEAVTTKLRVVFNASAKTTSGKSLNDVMYKGPNLQHDLQALILKWRQYRFAYTADLEKMYRQIYISEDQQPLQKIIWRDSRSESIKEYQLTTVTYGTKAAPFLAIMTLRRLATDESKNYPDAANVVKQSMYSDDLVSGSHTLKSGQNLINELCKLMKSGGFTLRKWSANNQDLLKYIKSECCDDDIFTFKPDNTGKTLGIIWNASTDQLSYKCNMTPETTTSMTKRNLLSEISKIYDPLGLLAPIVTKFKILFQKIWQEELKWDDIIPQHIYNDWYKLKSDINIINEIELPRWLQCSEGDEIEFHGFSDASIKCYAAVVYARIRKQDQCSVVLVAAKTKLAPNKKVISLPRLELCGAHLLSKLLSKISDCYKHFNIKVYGWTDSMVVLGWINGDSGRWKSFVSNRVKQITESVAANKWRYVKTKENPADAASRGLSAGQLKNHKMWWNGPEWLTSSTNIEETNQEQYTTNYELKIKQSNMIQLYQDENIISHLLQKYNQFYKIVIILSWILRALTPCKESRPTYITLREMNSAKLRIIKFVQYQEFATDMQRLRHNNTLKSTSKLLNLNPYIDQEGVLRVGGRLKNANLSLDEKNPIIIPKDHRLTQLLIEQAHQLTYHGGVKLTLSNLRKKYWIISGIRATKKYIRRCVTCRRHSPEIRFQMMGDLPPARVNPAPPFYHTGVDYTGYVDIKTNKGRGVRTTKGYIVVFICMVTKAIHLEVVSDLTSAAFLAALRRMAARRGCPRHIYSDNGTNFVKSARILQESYFDLHQTLDNHFHQELTKMQIQWHFNAPSWPTAGGLWERAVRSLKHHLKRTIGEQKLTFEEYCTLLTQIEACLNSRPLCTLTESLEDIDCLTPAHFLTGRAGLSVIETAEDARTRWNLITKIHQDIWKKWKNEYLSELSVRSKWLSARENIKIGDVVIIKDDNVVAGKWPMGRVTELHPGSDGLVRVVTLKTKSGMMKRPISKLSLLPIKHQEEEKESQRINKSDAKKSHEESNVRKDRQNTGSKFLSLALMFIYFMTLVTSSSATYSVTSLDSNKSLYLDPLTSVKHIRDEWTMVVYFNMSPYWQGFVTVTQFIKYLDNTCHQIKEQSRCNMILSQLRHDQTELEYYNELLMNQNPKSHSRQRRGLINGIGYVANSLFGVLDERFAEKYTQDIELIHKNEKHLAALWHNQTSVIESQFNLLKRTEEIINSQHKAINNNLNSLVKATNHIQEQLQNLSISEDFALTSIAATNMVTRLKNLQDTLIDTLTDTFHGRLNIHLLTPKQLSSELHTISGQLKEELRLPIDNIPSDLQKIYQLLHVKARMTESYFIFEIKFPLISRDNYELHKIIPIPQITENNEIVSVIPISNYIAINVKKDTYIPTTYEEIQTCLHYDDSYLCTLKSPINYLREHERFCKLDRITNNKCLVVKSSCKDLWTPLTALNTYLYFSCSEVTLRIICTDQITTGKISKAGLIHFEEKCIVKGPELTIYSHDLHSKSNSLYINHESQAPQIAPINHILNISLPAEYIVPDDLKQINKSLTLIHEQINTMKETAETSDYELSYHDIHQYVLSYAAVIGIIILAALFGYWRWGMRPVDQAQVAESRARVEGNGPTLSASESVVNISDESVDKATSPVKPKRVLFTRSKTIG